MNERTGLSAVMALKLAATFNTTAEFWLNAQKAMDLYIAGKNLKKLPKSVILDPVIV